MARHYTSVPAGSEVSFPRACPFTGLPNPQSKVRLAKTVAHASSGAFSVLEVCLLLFGGLHVGRTSTKNVRIPANRRFAWKVRLVEFAMWSCFVVTLVAVAFVFAQIKLLQAGVVEASCLGGTIVVTALLKMWHYRLLRPVVLGNASDYFVEIGFLSHDYAQEFASLNKVFVETR